MGLRAVTGLAATDFEGAEAFEAFFEAVTLVVFFAVAMGTRGWSRHVAAGAATLRILRVGSARLTASLLWVLKQRPSRAGVSCNPISMDTL